MTESFRYHIDMLTVRWGEEVETLRLAPSAGLVGLATRVGDAQDDGTSHFRRLLLKDQRRSQARKTHPQGLRG